MNLSFAAIDFETATGYMESACAVGIVTVTDGEITDEYYSLIQPPENEYWRANMLVHGITPGMTESLPGFHAIYPEVKKRLQGNVVVAHNEQFDRNVLKNTMRMYGLDYDELSLPERWECTCRIYRSLGYKPVNLSACCEREGIELKHHEALSDARGCAKLYLNFLEKSLWHLQNIKNERALHKIQKVGNDMATVLISAFCSALHSNNSSAAKVMRICE